MEDVSSKIGTDRGRENLLDESVLKVVIVDWTEALSGFATNATVSRDTAYALAQIERLYNDSFPEIEHRANELNVGRLNEHGPATVLFMVLFRLLQEKYATKQNLNPHKIAVLLESKYSVH
jgi:hypothetical protein